MLDHCKIMQLNFFFFAFPKRLLVMRAKFQYIVLVNPVFYCLLNFTFYLLIVLLCWQDRYLNYFIGGATVLLVSVSTVLGQKSKIHVYCILIFSKDTSNITVHEEPLKCKCIITLVDSPKSVIILFCDS